MAAAAVGSFESSQAEASLLLDSDGMVGGDGPAAATGPDGEGGDAAGRVAAAGCPAPRRRLKLGAGLSVSNNNMRKVSFKMVLLSVVILGVLVWRLVTPADPEDLDALGEAPDALPATDALDDILDDAAAGIFVAPQRRLDGSEVCVCPTTAPPAPSNDGEERIGLFMCHHGHLTKRATYNALCRKGESVCIKEEWRWMLGLYALGILYMFLALAIVCDEFFVPSLECFTEELNISKDVAGATFMAAGGSMPELFTSAIGTFKGSSVGIAAIVGSAVFNVLFVIATCAIASDKPLQLSWWPLARDCSYYMFTLVTLALCFSGSWSAQAIEPWEAGILFSQYIGYCCFMKVHHKVRRCLERCGGKKSKVVPGDGATRSVEDVKEEVEEEEEEDDEANINASFVQPSTFRRGIVHILTQCERLEDSVGIAAVVNVQGNLKETFKRIDKDGNGLIEEEEFRAMLETMGLKPDDKALAKAMRSIGDKDGNISFDAFQKWYKGSEARINVSMKRLFEKYDEDHNGFIDREELTQILKHMGHKASSKDVEAAMQQMLRNSTFNAEKVVGEDDDEPEVTEEAASKLRQAAQVGQQSNVSKLSDNSKQDTVTYEDFSRWYQSSLFWQEQAAPPGFTIEFPEESSASQVAMYGLTYPLCSMMYVTMPDVRNPRSATLSMAVLEFVLSLIWIGVFSISLVEWTEVISNTIGIPLPVAGVSILAAGTSIPDLLSSYVVAKKGEGDMAVSSSIGSNIFDVTVGLPLPWLAWSLMNDGKEVKVDAKGIGFFISLLVVMIAAVILTVKLCKWQMTKSLGYIMFALYFAFICLFLLAQMPEDKPYIPLSF